MTTHYQPTAGIPIRGLLLGSIAAVIAGALCGPAYAFATVHIPIVQINILLTILFGAVVGFVIGSALRAGRTQKPAVGVVFVAGGALFAYWVHWMFWFYALALRADIPGVSPVDWLLPPFLLEDITAVYDVGTWSMRSGDAVSGLALGGVWLAEAALFFGTALITGAAQLGGGVLCARCDKWCEAPSIFQLHIDPAQESEVVTRTNGQDWAALLQPLAHPNANHFHEVVIHRCPECRETNTLTLSAVSLTLDKQGNTQRNSQTLADRVYITHADAEHLGHSLVNGGTAARRRLPPRLRPTHRVPEDSIVCAFQRKTRFRPIRARRGQATSGASLLLRRLRRQPPCGSVATRSATALPCVPPPLPPSPTPPGR